MLQEHLFSGTRSEVFVHDQHAVTDSLAGSFVQAGRASEVPVSTGSYETMPTPGYDCQSWMLAEVKALEKAVPEHVSTEDCGLGGRRGEREHPRGAVASTSALRAARSSIG